MRWMRVSINKCVWLLFEANAISSNHSLITQKKKKKMNRIQKTSVHTDRAAIIMSDDELEKKNEKNKRIDTNHSISSRNRQKWLIWYCFKKKICLCQFIDVSVIRMARMRKRRKNHRHIQWSIPHSQFGMKWSCSISIRAFYSNDSVLWLLIVLSNYGHLECMLSH